MTMNGHSKMDIRMNSPQQNKRGVFRIFNRKCLYFLTVLLAVTIGIYVITTRDGTTLMFSTFYNKSTIQPTPLLNHQQLAQKDSNNSNLQKLMDVVVAPEKIGGKKEFDQTYKEVKTVETVQGNQMDQTAKKEVTKLQAEYKDVSKDVVASNENNDISNEKAKVLPKEDKIIPKEQTGDVVSNQEVSDIDIHLVHPILGHTGHTIGHQHKFDAHIHANTIAIGGGLTSAKIDKNASKDGMLRTMPLFNALIPSFCATCGTRFDFHFYFAYDYNDPLFTNPHQLQVFSELFKEQVKAKCPTGSIIELHMVQCYHTKKPAWAQNDAMMEAYIDNMEYFYRVNDDSKMEKSGWADIFVKRLSQFQPPNLGVVGPAHRGGNMQILTYDFTHHTHQDMFGFHYPRDFTDWFADDWVTKIYLPGRGQKMHEVPLSHTMQLGQRYSQHMDTGKYLTTRYKKDKPVLQRYVTYLETPSHIARDPSKVLAISLCDIAPIKTMGALRNVQQAPLFFPEWTVRVYVPSPNVTETPIPERLLNKMETLGAEIFYIDKLVHPKEWLAYHIMDDASVSTVLMRDAEYRLSDRQHGAVAAWMQDEQPIMHCMRDHISHTARPLISGLLGIKLNGLREQPQLLETFKAILKEKLINSNSINSFEARLWEEFSSSFLCHDSVSCDKWENSKAFPVAAPTVPPSYEGQRYDSHMEPMEPYTYKDNEHVCTSTKSK